MKRILIAWTLLLSACVLSSAQNFRSGYFLPDYDYRYRLNPAFTSNEFIATFLGQETISLRSPLSLKNFIFPAQDGESLVTGLHGSVDDDLFLAPFNNKLNPIIVEQDLTLFARGINRGNVHHIIDVSLRSGAAVNIPYDTFVFLKTGTLRQDQFDMKDLFVKTHTWLELSYGQTWDLTERLSVGARLKGLIGLSYASLHARQLDMKLSEDVWELHSKMDLEVAGHFIDIKMNTQKDEKTGEEVETNEVNLGSLDYSIFKLNGFHGLGASLDVGVEWKPIVGLSLSAAVLDFGGLKWFDHLYAQTPAVNYVYDPMHTAENPDPNNNAINNLGNIARFIRQDYKKNTFDWMTATLLTGAQYRMPFWDKMDVGLIGLYKVDNLFNWWETRASVNIAPWKWFSMSVTGGRNTYGWEYGGVLNFNTGLVSIFLGTDSISLMREITPQGIPLSKLNINLTLGLSINLK